MMKKTYVAIAIAIALLILFINSENENENEKGNIVNSKNDLLVNDERKKSIKESDIIASSPVFHNTNKEIIVKNIKKEMTLEEILNNISKGEKIEPIIVAKALKDYFKRLDENVNIAVTLKLTPVFHMLNDNYLYYNSVIFELFRNKDNHELLRMPMLEIISNHLDDPASLQNIKEVFLDKSAESSLMLGKSAKALAKNKIDISVELLDRYSGADNVAKNYYAKSFAYLKTKEAMDMIESDLDEIADVSIKSSLIQSFTDIDPKSVKVIKKLENMIDNSIDKSTFNNSEKEILMVQTIVALSKSNNGEVYEKYLMDIVSNREMALSSRATALDSYYGLPENIDKGKIEQNLLTLLDNLKSSKNSGDNEKEYLSSKVENILNILNKEK